MSWDDGMNATFGSLFAGIGGLDLGLERSGWTCKWQVEIDPYCLAVLRKHWPNVPKFSDIRQVTGSELEPVDLVAGGFPCQPTSLAGKRRGQADERWLWPEMARVLRVLRPTFVLVENPPGLLSLGFDQVLGDLAALRYDAEWNRVSAASVGAPHLRERIFIVGYDTNTIRCTWKNEKKPTLQRRENAYPDRIGDVADASSERLEGTESARTIFSERCALERREVLAHPAGRSKQSSGSQCNVGGFQETILRTSGHSDYWAIEPDVGRVAHGVPTRVDRLRCLGNAVVPQVAEWVGRRIMVVLS
jgi:DNA (cytosine-5)-methyltransferase 1